MTYIANAVAVGILACAAAAPSASAAPIAPLSAEITRDAGIVVPAYYWHGRYYPYRWHGGYYPYRWHGHYYHHRYYRHGYWRYW